MGKWYDVLNGLQDQPDELQDVLVELDLLAGLSCFSMS